MSSFLTQCPHCLTPFRVTDTQLDAAEGVVRCGACLGIFSAAANRITLKQTPEEAAAAGLAEPEDDAEFEEESDEEGDKESGERSTGFAVYEEYNDETEEAQDDTTAEESAVEPEELPATSPAPGEPLVEDLLDQDVDIQLGDLNLDAELEPLDEEEDFDDEETDDEEDESDEYEDDPEEGDEEYADEDEEEEDFDDEYYEEESLAEADEALAAADDEFDEAPQPIAPRVPVERITTDKAELRRHLSAIEDDDALEPLDDEALDDFDEPVTLVAVPRRSRLAGISLFLANVLLAGVLVWQYANANIETLSRNARFTPLLPYACRVLNCPAAERSQLNRLVTEQLVVRSHPRYAQALEVNLVFRNDASEAQPFPALELGFSDASGRLLANRLFSPAEYLPNELQTSEMLPRSSLQVPLEMADPGSEAVNYTLVFREP